MIKHDDEYYKSRTPQPDLGVFQNFKRFLWDSKKKAFLGRTAREWGNIGIFYLIFYGVLFSIFAIQMYLTYKYVKSYKKPILQYTAIAARAWFEPSRTAMLRMSSLQLHGPGIVMKPNIIPDAKPPLILLDETHEIGNVKNYIIAVRDTLAEYKTDKSKYDPKCNDNVLHEENSEKSCFFDVQTLGKCSQAPYGYTTSPQPCVYIKFNKRFGWVPIFYSQASFLPDDMPNWLKKIIRSSDKFHVWLSCEGSTEEGNANAVEIEYLPTPGFPVHFFPFTGQEDYLTPMVALHFKKLPVNQLVNVECKTWARNIDNENRYNLNFRILIKNHR